VGLGPERHDPRGTSGKGDGALPSVRGRERRGHLGVTDPAPTPVEAYLSIQRRYAHLFGEHPHTEVIARLQAIADKNIETYGLLDDEAKQATPEGIDE